MIRRLMLIFGSIVLAAIGFLTYLWWQSPAGVGGGSVVTQLRPTPLKTGEDVSGIGAGEGVWIKQYDKDGNLSSILRAKKYIPRQNGSVVDVVEQPSA